MRYCNRIVATLLVGFPLITGTIFAQNPFDKDVFVRGGPKWTTYDVPPSGANLNLNVKRGIAPPILNSRVRLEDVNDFSVWRRISATPDLHVYQILGVSSGREWVSIVGDLGVGLFGGNMGIGIGENTVGEGFEVGVVNVVSVEIVGAPSTGLIVRRGGQITLKANILPSTYIPPMGEPKWYYQKMQADGTWANWMSFGNSAVGKQYTHTTTEGGIFRVKTVLTIDGVSSEKTFLRTADDPHSDLNAGDPDAFGVVNNGIQIAVRGAAHTRLGSTYYSAAGSLPNARDPLNLFDARPKCNVFVADACEESGADVDPPLNGVYLGSPPSANGWAAMPDINDPDAPYPIPNWMILGDGVCPQPGQVSASGFESGAHGHVGIVDYDGHWISAGPTTVNRRAEFSAYKKHYQSGITSPAGKRSFNN